MNRDLTSQSFSVQTNYIVFILFAQDKKNNKFTRLTGYEEGKKIFSRPGLEPGTTTPRRGQTSRSVGVLRPVPTVALVPFTPP